MLTSGKKKSAHVIQWFSDAVFLKAELLYFFFLKQNLHSVKKFTLFIGIEQHVMATGSNTILELGMLTIRWYIMLSVSPHPHHSQSVKKNSTLSTGSESNLYISVP